MTRQPFSPVPAFSIARGSMLLPSLILVCALFGAACSSGDAVGSVTDASSGSVAMAEPAYAADDAAYEAEAMEEEAYYDDEDSRGDSAAASVASQATEARAVATGSAANETARQLPDTGREIVYTADLALATSDVTITTRDAIRAVELRGGYLFTQDTAGGVNGYSTLVFKVPPSEFQSVLSELGSIGSVRSQSVSAEDVTAVVVDLESRINTSEASVLRLRSLLDGATDIKVIAELENQLLQRETALEQLRGRLRVIERQVDFATITVRVTELLSHPAIAVELASYASQDGGFSCQDRPLASVTEPDTAFTLCWLVSNVGDTALLDITVTDPAIASLGDELLAIEGSTARLEPGETAVLAYEFETNESIRIRSEVEATPVALDGTTLADAITAISRNFRLDVVEPSGGMPGFGEVLTSSWNALKVAAIVVALVLVAIAPFLAIALPLGWLVLRLLRRRNAAQPASSKQADTPPPPPPPAPAHDELTPVQ